MAHYTIRPVSTGSFAEAETSLLYYLADDRNAGVKIPAVYWMFVLTSSPWLKPGDSHCFPLGLGGSRFTDRATPKSPRAATARPAAVSPTTFGSRVVGSITNGALNALPAGLHRGTAQRSVCEGAQAIVSHIRSTVPPFPPTGGRGIGRFYGGRGEHRICGDRPLIQAVLCF